MSNQDYSNDIAIVGMAGRFPGAKNIEAFWSNLRSGVESLAPISLEDWAKLVGTEPEFLDDPSYIALRPKLDDIEMFDATFFGYAPRDAAIMDPQQRLFLECAWEALENAGYDSHRYEGLIGVCAGVNLSSYYTNILMFSAETMATFGTFAVGLANMHDSLTTRVAYKLDLRGASYAVQSFCSSSLVAVHVACQNLLNHECDMMLAGGVSIVVPQETGYRYQDGGILSPDGHTRTFDAKAQGTVFGSGLGIVVLKRMTEALKDGDHIYASIKGSALNNDGSLKVSYTAPSVNGQAEVVVEALAAAGISADDISYVETHGTATRLGDPAEVAALTKAFRATTDRKGFCALGAVKSNVGHLDMAAGVTGLIKTSLMLKHKELVPSLNFETPNPTIDFANSPFFVNDRLREWDANGRLRRAGVSAFGIGGTNSHAILEEAPYQGESPKNESHQVLLLSAKTETALDEMTERLEQHLKVHTDLNIADVAFTIQVGRRIFNHRRAVVCRDVPEAILKLASPKDLETVCQDRKDVPVAFMFTGQGAQYVGMGRDLYNLHPVFREAVDRCCEQLEPLLGLDLRKTLYAEGDEFECADKKIHQTWITQPALFVTEYATACLWKSWGVSPCSMIGHSIGEYVAAHLAGVFSMEDVLTLVAARGRLMYEMPAGSMLAVSLSAQELGGKMDGTSVSLATINGPQACVISGQSGAVDEMESLLTEQSVPCSRLRTSHAFHSAMMDPIVPSFIDSVRQANLRAPQLPFVSNVTGTWITDAEATDPAYWARHLRQVVRFSDGICKLMADNQTALLEIGPGHTLVTLAKQHPDEAAERTILPSMRHPKNHMDDDAFAKSTLGSLWMAGCDLDWNGVHAGARRRRLPLPTYPFQRQRYWAECDVVWGEIMAQARGIVRKRQPLDRWFYEPSWKRSTPPSLLRGLDLLKQPGRWLLFVDECGLGEKLAQRLKEQDQYAVTVRIGETFSGSPDEGFVLDPGIPEHYDRLVTSLVSHDLRPSHILHLWSVTARDDARTTLERLDDAQSHGFYSVVFLAQALARANLSHTMHLAAVTNNAQNIAGGDLTCPEKTTLAGPCKVIPQEFPHINSRCIDILLPPNGSEEEARLVGQVLAEIAAGVREAVVAYRGGHRWVQWLEPTPLDETGERRVPLRERGIYLITGGLGGIGLTLARHLASTVRARLVLVGRTNLPDRSAWSEWLLKHGPEDAASEKIRAVQAIEEAGGEVLVVAGDVASAVDTESIVMQATQRFGVIHGVIHAAGVPGGGLIQLKERDVAEKVFSPKVRGTLVLAAAFEDVPLDFMVLCSSTAALLGGFGQVDYCGANAFMDAFAQQRQTSGGFPVFSINWDAWKEVGMAVNTKVSEPMRGARQRSLRLGIAPNEGVEAFNRIITAGMPQTVVFTIDVMSLLLRKTERKGRKSESKQEATAISEKAEPAGGAVEVAPESIEGFIGQIWKNVLGVPSVAVSDNFFELGGDSLLAIQVITQLKNRLRVNIPMVLFYESPTVASLASSIEALKDTGTDDIGQEASRRLEMMRRREPHDEQPATEDIQGDGK